MSTTYGGTDRNLQLVHNDTLVLCGHDITINKLKDNAVDFHVDDRALLKLHASAHKIKKLILYQCDGSIDLSPDIREWFKSQQIEVCIMGEVYQLGESTTP